jgi:hypothetical protein
MHAKPITIWLAGSVAATMAAQSGLAQTSLSVGTVRGYPGVTASVPVLVAKARNVTAAQFDVDFIASKVTSAASLLGASIINHIVRSREIAPGVRRILVYSLANSSFTATGRTDVATMPFTVAPQERVGSGPITPANVILARANATAVAPVTLGHGTIFVTPVFRELSGVVDHELLESGGSRTAFDFVSNAPCQN